MHQSSLVSAIVVLLVFMSICGAMAQTTIPVDDSNIWGESVSNPLFGGPTLGVDRAYYPVVLKVGATYHVWYGDGNNTRHTTSTNPDFSGAAFPAPVITGMTESGYHPRVLYDVAGWDVGGTHYAGPFLMYYTNVAWSKIYVAHSADGQAWTEIGLCTGVHSYGGNASIYTLAVLYEGGTTWKAYADNGFGWVQYYTSANGLNWTGVATDILGSPLQSWETSHNFSGEQAYKIGDYYVMFYGSGNRSSADNNGAIGMAVSTNGQTWVKSNGNPILSVTGAPAWRDDRTYTAYVIPDGSGWNMYFTGRSTVGSNYKVGYATSTGLFKLIEDGINAASSGDIIDIAAGTYTVSSVPNLSKANLTIQGAGSASTIIQVSGTGDRFSVTASGVTIQNLQMVKTDMVGVQNIIYVGASNFSLKNSIIHGQFVIGDGDVSRAIIIAGGLTGLLIDGNTIYALRQPAYMTGPTTGNITNNYVYGTKGWVLEGGNISMSGNTWGTGAQTNVYDVAILSLAPPTAYTDIVAMSNANNGAVIEDQRVSPAVLSVVYVDASTSYVSDLGGRYHPYATIAPAITRVVAGGTIHVAAGAYHERLNVVKSLDLQGAQYGIDPTPTGARTNPALESIVDVVGLGVPNPDVLMDIPLGVTNVHVSGFTLNGGKSSPHNADQSTIRCWDDHITIQDNIIDGYTGVLYKGNDYTTLQRNRITASKNGIVVQPNPASNVMISNNKVDLTVAENDPQGIYLTGVSSSSVTGNRVTGFVLGTTGGGLSGSNLTSLLVSGNTLTGNRKAVSFFGNTTFITISGNMLTVSTQHGIDIKGQDISITGNVISGNGMSGVKIDKHTLTTERVSISNNSISGNTNYGVEVNTALVTEIVNASGNWWGSSTPAWGSLVTAGVDYTPWMTLDGTYMNPGFSGDFSDLRVDDNSPQSGSTGRVQEGINLVSGSTVHVAAGTYVEGPQLVINKDITVAGEDKLTTIITPSANTGSSGDARGWWLVNAGKTFNLSNVTLDGSGKNIFMAVLSHGSGTIDNNIIKNMRYAQYLGMGLMMYGGNFTISNNTLMSIERIGMYCNGPGVTSGLFTGNTYTGKGNGDWLDYGIELERGAVASVTGNTITNCTGVAVSDGSTSAGMYLTTYFAPGTTGTFTGNIVTNNYVGLEVGYDGTDASIAVAHNNVFSGNTGYGVHSTNPSVDATYNYWGSLNGPADPAGTIEMPFSPKPAVAMMKNAAPAGSLGSAVTDNVDYYPWNGPNQTASGGGVWVGGYVNPVSNDIFAGFDPAATDGVDGFDFVAPPPPPSDYLYLYFLLAPGQPIENYAIDIKKEEASTATTAKRWSLKAITDHTSALVTLVFPDGGLPTGFKPTLYDLTTGNYQDIRMNPVFTYTSPPTTTVYSFALLMGDSTKPSVTVLTPNGGEFLVVGAPYNITWSSSDASGILRHYIYYSATGAAPYTLIDSTNGGTLTYSWTPLSAASTASIKVVARDSVLNEQYDVSDHTFTILASNSISFSAAAGWNLVSPPLLQGTMTPAAVFGDDYGATPYYTFQFSPVSGYSVPATLTMGQGYWLGSNSPQVIDVVGTPLSSASGALAAGFNIIGNPFAAPLLKADLRFFDGVNTKNMADAALAGWLSNVLYGYSSGSYFVESSTLAVWNGYWIPMIQNGITIQYTPSVVVPTPKVAEAEVMAANHWSAELTARLDAGATILEDRVGSFGVRSDATAGFDPFYDAPRPPQSPAKDAIAVKFQMQDQSTAAMWGDGIARDYRPAEKASWDFIVSSTLEGQVTLSWNMEALKTLPANVKVDLIDVASHRHIDMKSVGSYAYEHHGTTHAFSVNKAGESIPTTFMLSQNYPNPFNPTTSITYGLPVSGTVRVEVYDALGQTVARLVDGYQDAGYHSVQFNADKLSTGIYVYRISAVSGNGVRYHETRKMMLVR